MMSEIFSSFVLIFTWQICLLFSAALFGIGGKEVLALKCLDDSLDGEKAVVVDCEKSSCCATVSDEDKEGKTIVVSRQCLHLSMSKTSQSKNVCEQIRSSTDGATKQQTKCEKNSDGQLHCFCNWDECNGGEVDQSDDKGDQTSKPKDATKKSDESEDDKPKPTESSKPNKPDSAMTLGQSVPILVTMSIILVIGSSILSQMDVET